jgi:rhamnose utilization protein RhaD (predicted bifunctional aldolase and dehydrogenase)
MTDLSALAALSARLGRDPMLVQGGGGNASVKDAEVLWVKASGKWLAHAEREPIFVPVALEAIRASIRDGADDPVSAHVLPGAALRPSIETTLHAVLPHSVVLHLHAIHALAAAVRADGRAFAGERLRGLRWAWVPYARPGVLLTRAVAAAADDAYDVLLLENHGLVVGAPDCASAWQLVQDVEARLAVAARPTRGPAWHSLAAAAARFGMKLPDDPRVHDLAVDPVSLRHLRSGVLFPDQVVFLGPIVPVEDRTDGTAWCLLPGRGVLLKPAITAGQHEMLLGLALLMQRLPADVSVQVLDAAEVAALAGWEAERYRIALDEQRRY